MFKNTSEEQSITIQKAPNIIFTPSFMQDMWYIIKNCDKEITWYGLVNNDIDEDGISTFIVEDIILPKQQVASTTTETDPPGLTEMFHEIVQKYGPERANDLLLWGHSHVNMGTSPSSQDDTQLREFIKDGCSFFIRVIANKRMEMNVSIYMKVPFVGTIQIDNPNWEIKEATNDEKDKYWQEQIKEKVSEITYNYPIYGVKNSKLYGYGYGFEDDFENYYGSMYHRKVEKKSTFQNSQKEVVNKENIDIITDEFSDMDGYDIIDGIYTSRDGNQIIKDEGISSIYITRYSIFIEEYNVLLRYDALKDTFEVMQDAYIAIDECIYLEKDNIGNPIELPEKYAVIDESITYNKYKSFLINNYLYIVNRNSGITVKEAKVLEDGIYFPSKKTDTKMSKNKVLKIEIVEEMSLW